MNAETHKPGWFENLYIVVSLLLVTQALSPFIVAGLAGDQALSDSNPATMFSALAVYAVSFALLALRPRHTARVLGDNPLLLAVFVLPLLSTFWSVDPGVTLRRALALAMTGIFCLYLATRLSADDLLRRLLFALFIGGVASLLYTAAFPGAAIEQSLINKGSWNGVYGHKAILGRIAAIAVVVAIYVRPRFRWERLMRWATIAIFLFLSVQSQSRASWLMMIGALGVAVIFSAVRTTRLSRGLKVAIAGFLGALVLLAAVGTFDQLLANFGRDQTFSGRTRLWEGATAVASEKHPMLGSGYRAFWTERGAEDVRTYIQNWGSLPAHGHNGYLDTWLELGIPGLAVLACFLLVAGFGLARRIIDDPKDRSWAAFGVLFFIFLLNNTSVTVAFKHTDIAWISAVLAFLYARGAVTARQPVTARVHREHSWKLAAGTSQLAHTKS